METLKTIQEKTFDLLEKTGLNWTVSKLPLFARARNEEGLTLETDSFGIFKNNTLHGEPERHLGTVKKTYQPFQNWELAETIIEASENLGLPNLRGGKLADCKKIYFQAELPKMYIGKSSVKRMITALNSHDGSTSIGFGSSNTVVICQNTFYRAFKDVDKFRHTITAGERIKTAIEMLKLTLQNDEMLMQDFREMDKAKLELPLLEQLTTKIFGITAETKKKDVSTRKLNQFTAFNTALSKSIEEQGETLYALFNTVTRYTNHFLAPKQEEAKKEFLMTGRGQQINLMGFNEIMDFINKNSFQLAEI